ncbi:ribosomal rna large subunit methyltransferase j protein, partial [Cystoisospora suis]
MAILMEKRVRLYLITPYFPADYLVLQSFYKSPSPPSRLKALPSSSSSAPPERESVVDTPHKKDGDEILSSLPLPSSLVVDISLALLHLCPVPSSSSTSFSASSSSSSSSLSPSLSAEEERRNGQLKEEEEEKEDSSDEGSHLDRSLPTEKSKEKEKISSSSFSFSEEEERKTLQLLDVSRRERWREALYERYHTGYAELSTNALRYRLLSQYEQTSLLPSPPPPSSSPHSKKARDVQDQEGDETPQQGEERDKEEGEEESYAVLTSFFKWLGMTPRSFNHILVDNTSLPPSPDKLFSSSSSSFVGSSSARKGEEEDKERKHLAEKSQKILHLDIMKEFYEGTKSLDLIE